MFGIAARNDGRLARLALRANGFDPDAPPPPNPYAKAYRKKPGPQNRADGRLIPSSDVGRDYDHSMSWSHNFENVKRPHERHRNRWRHETKSDDPAAPLPPQRRGRVWLRLCCCVFRTRDERPQPRSRTVLVSAARRARDDHVVGDDRPRPQSMGIAERRFNLVR